MADVFKASDMSSCQAKRAKEVKAAQAAIMTFKSSGGKLGCKGDAAWVRVEGGFIPRVTLYTFGKKSTGRKVYDSILEIGVNSFNDLKKEYGNRMDGIACPWHVVPIVGAETSKNTHVDNAANRQMRSIASGGKLDANNVTAIGFTAGSVVEKKNKDQHTTQKYKIKRLEEHVVIAVSLT